MSNVQIERKHWQFLSEISLFLLFSVFAVICVRMHLCVHVKPNYWTNAIANSINVIVIIVSWYCFLLSSSFSIILFPIAFFCFWHFNFLNCSVLLIFLCSLVRLIQMNSDCFFAEGTKDKNHYSFVHVCRFMSRQLDFRIIPRLMLLNQPNTMHTYTSLQFENNDSNNIFIIHFLFTVLSGIIKVRYFIFFMQQNVEPEIVKIHHYYYSLLVV